MCGAIFTVDHSFTSRDLMTLPMYLVCLFSFIVWFLYLSFNLMAAACYFFIYFIYFRDLSLSLPNLEWPMNNKSVFSQFSLESCSRAWSLRSQRCQSQCQSYRLSNHIEMRFRFNIRLFINILDLIRCFWPKVFIN